MLRSKLTVHLGCSMLGWICVLPGQMPPDMGARSSQLSAHRSAGRAGRTANDQECKAQSESVYHVPFGAVQSSPIDGETLRPIIRCSPSWSLTTSELYDKQLACMCKELASTSRMQGFCGLLVYLFIEKANSRVLTQSDADTTFHHIITKL